MEKLSISDEAGGESKQQQQQQPSKKQQKKKNKQQQQGNEDGKPKLSRAEIKAQRLAARGAKGGQQQQQEDPLAHKYGDMKLVQSQTLNAYEFTELSALEEKVKGTGDGEVCQVRMRGRLHAVRGKGKSAFVVLRSGTETLQCVFFVDKESKVVSKGMIKYVTGLSKESIVDVEGVAVVADKPVDGCSIKGVEIQGTGLFCVSRAAPLPFDIADACRREDDTTGGTVNQDTRLNNRYIDLRTPANNAIFRIQSAVGQLFRENMLGRDFVEIHSPKIMAGSSEGGSSVFELSYMGRPACLAQSPQLCKQMAICADFGGVFEIGPVFRAEKSFTHRHLCEFVGMDFEMPIKEHYFELLDVIDDLFVYMFDGLKQKKKELEAINAQYPFEPLEYLRPSLRLTFEEGVKMLQEAGVEIDPLDDLSTETERLLGKLVKEKYKTDFYILHRYPLNARPFYTMPAPDNPDYTNSYDVFIRGEEIISGAQRIHDPVLLTERAKACGLDVATIESYIKSFSYGAPPHGGCGVGLERVAMLYLGLNNIRKTSLFPRDPTRLTPP
ncbi:aspartyl-tRNA synthetase [Chloropicon primus]|uniref:aspartate--tRNA ligase n=1 Tax=Chloropicon primus TaxID=1764295 RepID=A0A5B8MY88_9CHLO|nr:aspartyl-tRNA synthetase [Chloropicon primus]UPR04943.1 aspartyl-tRNA synthetase [Chloropicon primus]|eukprot:QDZ25748.1 aspartyl-tRNA synthetase [Chloropicon primus]